ncbi:early protein [human papillomavirus 40]|uniref:Protein E6 n=2 Tax=Human papillomavirus 40 TaxID=10615 RepID=VE6_HPV40|nr:RecName: Full=Protein E6 [human papillomavirus 40]ALT54706.1 E6 [human papillomavirus 40]QEE83896.1 E6 [human papillomavirus 40]WBM83404.1 E6 protein [human papillomavirus 40]CAA52567.1 early protein [human papillomavirus 40]CAD1807001.1 early protein [human papillomavirus 40]
MSARCGSQARTLYELCDQCNITLPTLQIDCVFCKTVLKTAEVLAFAFRELYVVWRDDFPHAACPRCLDLHGKVNQYRNFRYAAYAPTVEEETGLTILQVRIRCCKCHKPLSPVEKTNHIVKKTQFFKLKDSWTGYCLHCWKKCMEKGQRSETLC